jgi:hypothetical protein
MYLPFAMHDDLEHQQRPSKSSDTITLVSLWQQGKHTAFLLLPTFLIGNSSSSGSLSSARAGCVARALRDGPPNVGWADERRRFGWYICQWTNGSVQMGAYSF